MKLKFKKGDNVMITAIRNRPVGVIKRFIRGQYGQMFCELKLNNPVDGEDIVVAKIDVLAKS